MDENPIQPFDELRASPQQPPVQPPAPVKFVFKIPLTLLVVVGLAVAGYFASAYYFTLWPFEVSVAPVPTFTPRPSPSPMLTTVDTSNWSKYNDPYLNFEVSYPREYFFDSDGINQEIANKLENYFVEMAFYKNEDRDTPFSYRLTLTPKRYPNIKSLGDYGDYLIKNAVSDKNQVQKFEISEITINGMRVAKIISTLMINGQVNSNLTSYVFYRNTDNTLFEFTLYPDQTSLAITEAIISTFKFTK